MLIGIGYSISRQGKPPEFVLEVTSPTTGKTDYIRKRGDYAAFGDPEYWRFDSSGGQYHDAPLAGDRLAEGSYRPIEIIQTDKTRLWGHSGVLNLDIYWEGGELRWRDPATQRYLDTHDEEAEGRIAERQARIPERQARIAAEVRAENEH